MIKASVIGLGYWGPNLLRNFYQHERVDLKSVCDINAEKLNKIAKIYKGLQVTQQYNDILKSAVDLVAIATPPETHYQIAKDCLEAGKHILVEKPFTLHAADAEKLIALAEKKHRKIFVDYTFIFHPVVRKIKEIIKSGELGNILYFDSERINLGLLQKEANVIYDLAVHDFSVLLYLLDNPDVHNVYVAASKQVHRHVEDMAHIVLEFKNGIIAHIHVSWISPVKIRKVIIGGSQKMLWWDDVHPFEKLKVYNSRVEVHQRDDNPFFPTYIADDVRIIKVENKEPLSCEIDSIVRSIVDDRPPEVAGQDGLRVAQLLERCENQMGRRR